jgi:hypothetical protein
LLGTTGTISAILIGIGISILVTSVVGVAGPYILASGVLALGMSIGLKFLLDKNINYR